ncbi:MAG: hypothetical protein INR71_06355, partial [Terriglobus roseus]|nr:hypothetical protein [Terriglobus roseus]
MAELTIRLQPQQQLSTIERSVTHLLVATKQLLETLTQWSRGSASENEVSDVYVRLGYEFNIACRAFNAIGVDTNDLGPVPDLLRAILEETLSQEASQQSLDRFLPRIRDIIINLLHGLKKKQQKIRQRPPRDAAAQPADGHVGRTSSGRSVARHASLDHGAPELPPRTTSVNGTASPTRSDSMPAAPSSPVLPRSHSSAASTMSTNTMQSIPVDAPYPDNDTMPGPDPPRHQQLGYSSTTSSTSSRPALDPQPPPKQQEALLALQRGGDLERRASRRFSTYQIKQ